MRIQRQAQQRIEHDAQQRAAALPAGAVGQAAIVGEHGSDARENRVVRVPHRLHVLAGGLAGDPWKLMRGKLMRGKLMRGELSWRRLIVRRRDFSIQRHRGLQRHQSPAGAHEMHEGFVDLDRSRRGARVQLDLHSGFAQTAEAAAGDEWIGILHGRNHPAHARRQNRVDARRRPAMVRARLQRDIERRALRPFPGLLQRQNLRMLDAGPGVEAAAHGLAVTHHHRAHGGVGRGAADAAGGQFQRFFHKPVHSWFESSIIARLSPNPLWGGRRLCTQKARAGPLVRLFHYPESLTRRFGQ